MIAERIYRGESAEQIGITPAEYASRRELLERYLAEQGDFSAEGYLAWLSGQAEGDPGANGTVMIAAAPQSPAPSRGLGDTIAKLTHATGLDRLAHLYTAVTGKDCGCRCRQQKLNALIPYGRK